MKYAKWMWAAAIVLLPNVLPTLASAQLGDAKIVANVPFEFRVLNKLVPAGEYAVQRGPGFSGALMIQNARAKVGVISYSSPGESKKASDTCALVFGNFSGPGINNFGGDAQYGPSNLYWFFGQNTSGPRRNPCLPQSNGQNED